MSDVKTVPAVEFAVSEKDAQELAAKLVKAACEHVTGVTATVKGTRVFFVVKGCTFEVKTSRPKKETVAELVAADPVFAKARGKGPQTAKTAPAPVTRKAKTAPAPAPAPAPAE